MVVTRVLATALLAFCLVAGWVVRNYAAAAVPALLAAWAAAYFGEEVGGLIGIGNDSLVRVLGLVVLVVLALASAAAHWMWLA
jgi:hypothetical protein